MTIVTIVHNLQIPNRKTFRRVSGHRWRRGAAGVVAFATWKASHAHQERRRALSGETSRVTAAKRDQRSALINPSDREGERGRRLDDAKHRTRHARSHKATPRRAPKRSLGWAERSEVHGPQFHGAYPLFLRGLSPVNTWGLSPNNNLG